jgi:Pectinacetylesterase
VNDTAPRSGPAARAAERRRRIGGFVLVASLFLFGLGTDQASPSVAGWVRVAAPGAVCARGDAYSFWTHAGARSKLLLYFQDGGGCWSYETCAPGSTFFQDSLRAPDAPSLPERGILDFANPSNPFRDFSMVYIPYCTGDVHWGNNVQRYSDGKDHTLTIHHVGFVNDRRVLAWAYRRYPTPKQVFVTGCSAGSVGSAVFAPYVIRHYPHAIVDQVGDSLAFVFPRPVNIQDGYRADRNLPRWIPAMRRFDPSRMTMAEYYSIVANFYTRHLFAQFDYSHDAVQTRYYVAFGGRSSVFPRALARSLAAIRHNARNFRSYVASGSAHCVLPLPRFYAETYKGTRLARWVTAIATGKQVPSVP